MTFAMLDPKAEAAARLAEGYALRAAMLADLDAWTVPPLALPVGYLDAVDDGSLVADGTTDNTAALQTWLDTLADGDVVFLPAGTYRVDGPVTVSHGIAFVGEAGTTIDCSTIPEPYATTHGAYQVFQLNPAGSLAAQLGGMSFTGIEFVGAGTVEVYGSRSMIAILDAWYLDAFLVDHCKFRNSGYAAVRLTGTADTEIRYSVFDNCYYQYIGYGVAVYSDNDRVWVHHDWFLTKIQHAVAIGRTGTDTVEKWARAVTVEDCYTENATKHAYDQHYWFVGPYTLRRNVAYACKGLFWLKNSYGGNIIEDNFGLALTDFGGKITTKTPDPATPSADVIADNVFEAPGEGLVILRDKALIAGNVIGYGGSYPAIDMQLTPSTTFEVEGNIYAGAVDLLLNPTQHATVVDGNEWIASLYRSTANFTAETATPYARQPVTFTDTSTGGPASWVWDFGDGEMSTEQHPVHSFRTAGTYPVTLTVDGDTTGAATMLIAVHDGVAFDGIELSNVAPWDRDHAPMAKEKPLLDGGSIVQGSTRDKRAWAYRCLAEDREEIDALAALEGERRTLIANGEIFPDVILAPPFRENVLRDGTHVYEVAFKQEAVPRKVAPAAVYSPGGFSLGVGAAAVWLFDDRTGTVLTDTSGFGVDGALVGSPTWGPLGLAFSGSGQHIIGPLLPPGTLFADAAHAWTVQVLVSQAASPAAPRAIVAQGSATATARTFVLYNNGSNWSVNLRGVSTVAAPDTTGTTLLTVTWDGSAAKLYIGDGTDAPLALTVGTAVEETAQPLTIGCRTASGPNWYWLGGIHYGAIYTYAIDSAQIKRDHAALGVLMARRGGSITT